MANESKKDILSELSGHLAAAADCVSFIRDKEVSDPASVTKEEVQWATEKYHNLMEIMNEVDAKRGR